LSFSNRINELLKEKRITKAQLAKAVGIPYTTLDSMLKRDSDTKRLSAVVNIAAFLGVTVEELVAGEGSGLRETVSLSDHEKRLINVYRSLDKRGRAAVVSAAESEKRYLSSERAKKEPMLMRIYESPAAAGAALPLITDDYTERMCEDVPKDASYGIKIKGDSMEPLISDGSIVWVRSVDTLDEGEIGIFALNGESLCKKLEYKSGRCFLVSLNPKYLPIEIINEDEMRVLGKVIL